MRAFTIAAWVVLCLGMAATSMGQAPTADPEDIGKLLQSLRVPANAAESAVVYKTEDGFVRFLGAPPDGAFAVPSSAAKAAGPEAAARSFVDAYKGALGLLSDKVGLNIRNIRTRSGDSYVRLRQTYGNLEVFAGSVVVQVDASGDVRNVVCEVMRDTRALDDPHFSLSPGLTAVQAESKARTALAKALADVDHIAGVDPAAFSRIGDPALMLFCPALIQQSGPAHLVWQIILDAESPEKISQRVLVDAQSGDIVFRHSLLKNGKSREIFDLKGGFLVPSTPARVEGGEPTGIADVDNTYDYLGDAYDYFAQHFGRDSYDDAGATIVALVHYSDYNAYWSPSQQWLVVGTDFAVDDIIAHEFTHANTDAINDLIYFGESGSITEHLSDTFGEFTDLTNGKGNDSEAVRWLLGEDLPQSISDLFNPSPGMIGNRNMKDPTEFDQPDRYNSPLFINPFAYYDYGGVHVNDGVGNKLVYLLTDGDSFNGQTVQSLGMDRVAQLVYGTEFLLPDFATYYIYYLALGASSVNLGMSFEDRLNIARAGRAVEIEPPTLSEEGLRGFRAMSAFDTDGNPVVALHWTNPATDTFGEVILVRSVGMFVDDPAQGTQLYSGRGDSFLDREVQSGVEYRYTLFADMTSGLPQTAYARATAGAQPPKVQTEAFDGAAGGSPIDLAYTQLTFTPVGPPPGGGAAVTGGADYSSYEATVRHDVFEFPVVPSDEQGDAWYLPLGDDLGISYTMGDAAFPFFGKDYSAFFLSPNGYISFTGVTPFDPLNFPSMASHFTMPRISFLFADLAPNIGGTIWSRSLDDRLVITFENVPEFISESGGYASPLSNSVQLELFFSGHIRMTYRELGVKDVLVGLSDGQGLPLDPAVLFDGLRHFNPFSNLSELPEAPGRMSIEPVALQVVDVGDLVNFTAHTVIPAGMPGLPVLTATWNGDGPAPFADNGNGTGTFYWQTTPQDQGLKILRIRARMGTQDTYQDVRMIVGDVFFSPEARNLRLSSGTPFEDPTRSRVVPAGRPLMATYDYFHPQGLDEGPSIVYWYRNNQIVPGLTGGHDPLNPMLDNPTVPPNATRAGDHWYFRVLPIALQTMQDGATYQVFGYESISPVVTIGGGPEVLSVTPNFGAMAGGQTVRIFGANLSGAMSVKFGGVPVGSVHAISKNELEVVTPLISAAGTVAVTVVTSAGNAQLPNAYSYQAPEIPTEEKTIQMMGCGAAPAGTSRLGDWAVLLAAALGIAVAARRRVRAH